MCIYLKSKKVASPQMRTVRPAGRIGAGPTIDYGRLTNRELQKLLWELMPEMRFFSVTDDTRQTAIAMLKIRQEIGKKY